tara:strand:- start:7 stop:222 length:216 start_codon:yes stop_codon:yes gene_type:complete
MVPIFPLPKAIMLPKQNKKDKNKIVSLFFSRNDISMPNIANKHKHKNTILIGMNIIKFIERLALTIGSKSI